MLRQSLPVRRLADSWCANCRFIIRPDVPVNRAEPVSSGRTMSSREIYVRQYLAMLFVLPAAGAFAAGSSAGYEQGALMRASSP